jgi:hypothetical protein
VLDKQEKELTDADAVLDADAVEIKIGEETNIIAEASRNELVPRQADGLDVLEEEVSSALPRLDTDNDSARDIQLQKPLEQLIALSQKVASVADDGRRTLPDLPL